MHGVIIVVDSKNAKYDNLLDEWVNGFCKNFNVENILCLSYTKESDGEVKQKTCNFLFKF
jgi:hypothetical protein